MKYAYYYSDREIRTKFNFLVKKKSYKLWNISWIKTIFIFVGFCKYGDKCKIEHAQGDCDVEKCDKKLQQNAQKTVQFGEECKHFKNHSCQFLHYNNTTDPKTVTDITNHLTQKKGGMQDQIAQLKMYISTLIEQYDMKIKRLARVHLQELEELKSENEILRTLQAHSCWYKEAMSWKIKSV